MSSTTRITRNFQITIPKEIRKQMPFLKEGDPVDFYLENFYGFRCQNNAIKKFIRLSLPTRDGLP